MACREGHLDAVQYLLHHGASVHAKDIDKKTPLLDAVNGRHYSIISLLVQTGANLVMQPVHLAMELCRYIIYTNTLELSYPALRS